MPWLHARTTLSRSGQIVQPGDLDWTSAPGWRRGAPWILRELGLIWPPHTVTATTEEHDIQGHVHTGPVVVVGGPPAQVRTTTSGTPDTPWSVTEQAAPVSEHDTTHTAGVSPHAELVLSYRDGGPDGDGPIVIPRIQPILSGYDRRLRPEWRGVIGVTPTWTLVASTADPVVWARIWRPDDDDC